MGHAHTVEFLLTLGVKPNPLDKSINRLTPLDYAVTARQTVCEQILLSHGGKSVHQLIIEAVGKIQNFWKGYKIRKICGPTLRYLRKQRKALAKASIQESQEWKDEKDEKDEKDMKIVTFSNHIPGIIEADEKEILPSNTELVEKIENQSISIHPSQTSLPADVSPPMAQNSSEDDLWWMYNSTASHKAPPEVMKIIEKLPMNPEIKNAISDSSKDEKERITQPGLPQMRTGSSLNQNSSSPSSSSASSSSLSSFGQNFTLYEYKNLMFLLLYLNQKSRPEIDFAARVIQSHWRNYLIRQEKIYLKAVKAGLVEPMQVPDLSKCMGNIKKDIIDGYELVEKDKGSGASGFVKISTKKKKEHQQKHFKIRKSKLSNDVRHYGKSLSTVQSESKPMLAAVDSNLNEDIVVTQPF